MAKESTARKLEPRVALAPSALPDGRIPDFERLIHERIRLAILSALAANPFLTFMDMRKLLATTDGNLSIHARKLEEAGYVACEKFFEGRVPRTEFRITAEGRRAFEKYLNHMEALIRANRE